MAVTRLAEITGGGHNTDGFDMVLDTTGADFVVVLVTYHTGTTGLPTATVDGVACTAHGATPSNGSRATRMLYIVNPTQGASITVSVRGTDSSISSTGVAIAYSGVDTAAPLGAFPTPTTGTNTTPATPTFAADAGDYVLMYFGHIGGGGGTTITGRGADQVQIAHATLLPTSSSGSGMLVDEGALGDTTGTWTISTTRDWGSAGVAIKAAAGGGPNTFDYTGSGGAQSDGVAAQSARLNPSASGGAQSGGVAIMSARLNPTAAGGMQSGGAATLSARLNPSVAGGAQSGGAAAHATTVITTGSGGGSSSGAGTIRNIVTYPASGGVQSGGAADAEFVAGGGGSSTFTYTGSGGVQGGGTATLAVRLNPPVSGGAQPGGAAPYMFSVRPPSSGGAQSAGAAVGIIARAYQPSGGGQSGGAAAHRVALHVHGTGGVSSAGAAETQFVSGISIVPSAILYTTARTRGLSTTARIRTLETS